MIESNSDPNSAGWDRLNFLAKQPEALDVLNDRFVATPGRLDNGFAPLPTLDLLEWACKSQFPIEQLRFLVKVCGIKPSTLALEYIFDEYELALRNKPYLCTHMLLQNGALFDRVRPFIAYAFAMHTIGSEAFNLLLLRHQHLWYMILNQRGGFAREMHASIHIVQNRVANARLAAIAILNLRRRRWRPELRDVWLLMARYIVFPPQNLIDQRWSRKHNNQSIFMSLDFWLFLLGFLTALLVIMAVIMYNILRT